jgi:hypothetical protein
MPLLLSNRSSKKLSFFDSAHYDIAFVEPFLKKTVVRRPAKIEFFWLPYSFNVSNTIDYKSGLTYVEKEKMKTALHTTSAGN